MAGHDIYQFRNTNTNGIGHDGGDMVLYESNKSGKFEVYYKQDHWSSGFGKEKQLTFIGKDISNFDITEAGNSSGLSHICCWETGDKIYLGEINEYWDSLSLETIALIDSVGCSNPIVTQEGIYWQKVIDNEIHIYKSDYLWNSKTKLAEIVMDNGNYHHLSCMTEVYYGGYPSWTDFQKVYYEDIDSIEFTEFDTISHHAFCFRMEYDQYVGGFSFGDINQRNIYFITQYNGNFEQITSTDDYGLTPIIHEPLNFSKN